MSRERIMLTQAIPAVQQLRRVQGFDPLRFLKRNANGGIELEPRYQRLWFRLACPDGKMLLNRLRVTDQIAVYDAQVCLSKEEPAHYQFYRGGGKGSGSCRTLCAGRAGRGTENGAG